MEDLIRFFGSREYCLMFLLLVFSRGMDIYSTWVATPNLVLEGNPVAKFLGWRWGIPVNIVFCIGMALSPVTAIAISTMSVLVAAHNFQSAWLMQSMGEEKYRDWHVRRIQETRITLYLSCLAGNTLLTAAVGAAVMYFSYGYLIPLSIGLGIITYAVAVASYTILAVWRLRRAADRRFPHAVAVSPILLNGAALKSPLANSCACEPTEVTGK